MSANNSTRGAPWFTAGSPWPWSHWGSNKTAGVGNPQSLLTPGSMRLGFSIGVEGSINGSNASSAQPGTFPATVGNVLNLSAAAIASAPAFTRTNNDQG